MSMLNEQQIQENIESVQGAIDAILDLIERGILNDSLRPTLTLLRDKEAEFNADLEQLKY